MTILRFDIAEIRKLLDLSLGAKDWRPTFSDCLDPEVWKPEAKPDEHGFVSSDDIDTTKIGPRLWLVKDRGCYMMSNATGLAPDSNGSLPVAYADGFGPDADYQDLRAALGGDDFVEAIKAGDIQQILIEKPGRTITAFLVDITPTQMSFSIETKKS